MKGKGTHTMLDLLRKEDQDKVGVKIKIKKREKRGEKGQTNPGRRLGTNLSGSQISLRGR